MDFRDLLTHLNWIDWAVVLIVALSALSGIRRGFVLGALDLLGLGVGIGAAVVAYRPLADLVVRFAGLPRSLVTLFAFLALFVLAQAIYSAVVDVLFHLSRPLRRVLGPLAGLEAGLGVIPGAAKGLLFAAVLLLPFATFPLSQPVSAGIERSVLASRLAARAVTVIPAVDALLGRELAEGLAFLTPPQTEEGIKTDFGPTGALTPDPAAEEEMFALVNRERQAVGLRPLQWDDRLRAVGRAHSQEMFQDNYFAHISPKTGSVADRVRRAAIPFTLVGENLAYAPTVRVAHEGLMNSPGHRENILRPGFTRIGIGAIRSQLRGRMFTQVFAAP
jgi:uncharacterized protein YkwD